MAIIHQGKGGISPQLQPAAGTAQVPRPGLPPFRADGCQLAPALAVLLAAPTVLVVAPCPGAAAHVVVAQVGALGIALSGVGLVNHNLTDLACRQGVQQEHWANEAAVASWVNARSLGASAERQPTKPVHVARPLSPGRCASSGCSTRPAATPSTCYPVGLARGKGGGRRGSGRG